MYRLLLLLLVSTYLAKAQTAEDLLQMNIEKMEEEYEKMDVPRLQLSYQSLLDDLGSRKRLDKQYHFFNDLRTELAKIDTAQLTDLAYLDYAILQHECQIHLQRIDLSQRFLATGKAVTDQGIFHQPNGKAWYIFLMQWWTSADVSPDEMMAFGAAEVAKVKAAMEQIKLETPNFDEDYAVAAFYTKDKAKVIAAIEQSAKKVDDLLFAAFPDFADLPKVNIAQGTNPALAQVPGFYSNNTFYFNLFEAPFDLRQVDWLFLHEGNPGHHFQINYEALAERPAYRELFSYSGFREGWAAYIENLGQELGLYSTPFHYCSKWEWDLIRSTRLILDVGINYYGWTDEEALIEWQKYIEGQDDIGRREIARMRRWPAQVLTYKVGERAMMRAKAQEEQRLGAAFDLKAFHTTLLAQASIPVKCIPLLFQD
ncbi:MAG: DUF885 family protein [Bacteroidota bacterium]